MTLYAATPPEVGWVLGLYNVGGFVASLVIPNIADRTRNYLRPLVFCALGGLALVAVLAVTTSLQVVVLAVVILGVPPGVGSTLLFAQLRLEGAPPTQVIRTRAIVSFAWVIGPPLTTLVTGAAGSPAALALLAGIGLVNVATADAAADLSSTELGGWQSHRSTSQPCQRPSMKATTTITTPNNA